MKQNVTLAAIVLMGIFCVWSYLSAGPVSEEKASPRSKLLEINEPSQADFEHCAKRAVDFFESLSEDQTQMDIAVHELFGVRELPMQLSGMSRQLVQIKNDITFGHPELMSRKPYGENMIVLYYHYHTNKGPLFFRYLFVRTLDQNGDPGHWQCHNINYTSNAETIIQPWPQ